MESWDRTGGVQKAGDERVDMRVLKGEEVGEITQ